LRGRVREGGRLRGSFDNDLQDAVQISQHVGIPESKNAITFCCEPSIPFGVPLRLRVLSTIDLDDEMTVVAHKVDDE